jgi:hypothetical protein
MPDPILLWNQVALEANRVSHRCITSPHELSQLRNS